MPKEISNTKADLIIAIQDLLQKHSLEKQEDIRESLQKQGIIVNQAMISRILHKLGAIKMNEGDGTFYRLPTELKSVKPDDSLKHLIVKITHNESIIIIQTAPGSAQLVARLLDQNQTIGILGTVAGDDTIFIAPEKTKQIATVFQKIYHHLLS